jgi:hypothetical protein
VAESSQHIALLQKLVAYVRGSVDDSGSLAVLHDLPGLIGCDKPPKIGAFRPDLYATDAPTTMVIVGEVKTARDLETAHSRDQLLSFLTHLSIFPNPVLMLAVPWTMRIRAQQLLSNLSAEAGTPDVTTLVVDDMKELI